MNENKNSINWATVIIVAGAMMATLIGSGFATGQEIIQYFVSWGWWGIAGAVLIFIGFAFVGWSFLTTGYYFGDQLDKPNDIYRVYAGKYIGTFFDWFSVFFLFLSYALMIGGAGATINQQYDVPYWVGALLMLVIVVITVALGLKRLTNILGSLGPLIAISTIILGIFALIKYGHLIGEVQPLIAEAAENGTIQVASENWWLAALNYVGFNMLWIAGFLGQQGKSQPNKRQAGLGGVVGALGFSAAILVMIFAFMSSFDLVAGSQVPTLILATDLHPWAAVFFSVVVMLGIYTSAVTLLWNVVSAFAKDRTPRATILSIVFGIAGYVLGTAFQFDELVNIIYVLNGYIGIFLIALMIFREIQWRDIKSKDR